ncbi:MAG: DUF4294 domain-containing protein [Flavobacteriales bacterium]|nr:DUF4294 domain-containing protein [Flavobacteriales bacterium]
MRLLTLFLGLFLFGLTTVSAQDIIADKKKSALKSKTDFSPPKTDEGTVSALINGKLYNAIIINGDTVPIILLPTVRAVSKRVFKSKRDEKKYYKLTRHVKKVLPYAKLAGKRMKEVEAEVANMSSRERKKRMKELEKEIKRDYEGELTKLSFTQGRILIKLLDRETGSISYDIVKEFRGGFTAWFFQGIAKMFDYDLKAEYDPEGDDKLIEEIVVKIENGDL